MNRRHLLAGLAALPAAARAAEPAGRDIRFIIPYGAGGGFDLAVRSFAPAIAANLPPPTRVIPDNITAGGGSLGVAQLYRARPDGGTLGVINIPGMFVLQRQGAAAYDLARFSYLGSMGRDAYGIAVAAGSPLRSMADLRALSASQPIRFTTTGREGTAFAATVIAMHLLGLRGRFITGYRGSNDYVVAAIRGDGDAVVATLPLLRQMQQGGLLRVLASFEPHSSIAGAEDATSLGQPGLSAIMIERIVAAPPGLPPAVQTRLAEALAAARADPGVRAWAQGFGTELVARTPAEAAALVAAQGQFYQSWKPELDAA